MQNNNNLVIFDFDGVLVDSLAQVDFAYRRIFETHGLPVPYSDFSAWYDSDWEKNWLLNGFTAQDVPRLVQMFFEHVDYDTMLPFAGIQEQLIEIAKWAGIAVASTTPARIIWRFLAAHKINQLIQGVYSPVSGSGKLNLIRDAMKDLHTSAEHTIMVGDTAADIRPAKALGCYTIGAGYGWYTSRRLSLEDPSYIIEKPSELAAAAWTLLQPTLLAP